MAANVVGVAAAVVVPQLLAVHAGGSAGDAAATRDQLVALCHEAGTGVTRTGCDGDREVGCERQRVEPGAQVGAVEVTRRIALFGGDHAVGRGDDVVAG